MFNLNSLLAWLIPCCAKESSDPSHTRAALSPEHIGILSARCCDSSAALRDTQLHANVSAALQRCGDTRSIVVTSITAAQSHLRQLEAEATPEQKRLIETVAALFQTHGLSIFPILIINGRVAFYGGVPNTDMICDTLQAQASAAVRA
jgi:hypothetical protein